MRRVSRQYSGPFIHDFENNVLCMDLCTYEPTRQCLSWRELQALN